MSKTRKPKTGKRAESLNGAARFRPWWVPLLWVIAPVAAVLSFYIIPFGVTLVTSFTNTKPLRPMGDFNAFENYEKVLSSPKFWDAVLNSSIYALCVVPIMVILPLLLALLVKEHVPGIGFFRAIYYIPAISSLVVISIAWRYLLEADGPINALLKSMNVIQESIPFLSDRWLILFCAMLITLWQGMPYYMILYLSALANVDKSVYEAAEIDGAGPVRRFFTVTVPGVKIMMYLVGVLSTIGCLKVFTEVFLLGGPNSPTQTITMYIRSQLDVTYGHLGRADATSVFLFLFTLGFIILSQKIQRKAEEQP
ncbi:ABC transporter permease [Boudabousia liubingyangii]|uniref:ABC transporter permease n=1 Tax=Boudabousia liubingyangii TaxID=1921764 RepID=A0A1Q5PNH1_9ACTO|nr:sugar ABC transporter permease [Boudabousia liubingyangii]OKL47640.1 ABC transporter permease [Boudabousia liubingyangii]OKL49066.1 ABC transporter permease [Boudabousia liubingyangii]